MFGKHLYFVLQFFVFFTASLLSFLSVLAIYPDAAADTGGIFNTLIQSFLIVFWSHVVIRFGFKRLKPKLKGKAQPLLTLAMLTLLATCAHTFIQPPKFDTQLKRNNVKVELESQQGSHKIDERTGKAMQLVIYGLFFTVWSGFYLALTDSRDRQAVQIKLQAQQLENLKNQLNPHFLFNALNSVRAMIFEDKEKAADLITELSELFRFNLTSQSDSLCPLKQELEICQRYLNIESTRLGERLTLKLYIPTETLDIKVPAMSLLTLVENAIKHGIAPLPEGGELKISAQLAEGELVLYVSNPFTENKRVDGTRIGLNNLKQRIAIIYGSVASLSTEKRAQTYNVQLRVPYAY